MPVMLTKITEEDWEDVLEVFDASQPERGEPGHGIIGKFPEALHFSGLQMRCVLGLV